MSYIIYFFTVATICILPASEPSSVFRRNHVADSILDFLDYFAETMSPMYLDYFVKTTSPILYLFLMTILAMETIQENFYYS